MPKPPRDVRVRKHPYKWDAESQKWLYVDQPIVLVDSNAWVLARRADLPNAAPFALTRKQWEKLPRE